MIFKTTLSELNLKNTVISIGNFDGVHLGHQMLLKSLEKKANTEGRQSVIISFFPPAKLFLRGGKSLSSRSEKRELLEAYNPDAIVMIPFDHDYAQLSKEVFIKELFRLEPKHIIVGEDFKFGNRREGNINDLSKIADSLEAFNLLSDSKGPISSSRIRALINESKVSQAAKLLGRNYSAVGLVVKGQQRGRTIGFPTANTQIADSKALPSGVFAVTAETSYGQFKAMANIGKRPSFKEIPATLEAHLFDFDADLYEQKIKINFHKFIRKERKFANIEDLKKQLQTDKEQALELLR